MSSIRLPGASQRFVVFSAMGALFTYAVVLTLPQASANEIAGTFRVSNDSLGEIFRLVMLGFLCSAIFGGWVSDRIGKMPVVAAGCMLMTAGMLVFWRAPGFSALKYGALVAGMGGGLAEVVSTAMISDMFEGPAKTSVLNLSQLVFSAGAFVQPMLFSQMLSVGIGWRFGYAVVAGLGIVAVMLTAVASVGAKRPPAARLAQRVSWYVILKHPVVLRMSMGLMLYMAAELGLASWLSIYLARDLRTSVEVAAMSVAVFWVGIGTGRLIATWLARRLSDDLLIRCSLGFAAVSISALLLLKNPAAGLAMAFLSGLPLGPAWPTIVSRTGYAFPRQTGSVVGVVAAAGCIGGAFGPSLIGRVSDATGIRLALWVCVASLILGLAVVSGVNTPEYPAAGDD